MGVGGDCHGKLAGGLLFGRTEPTHQGHVVGCGPVPGGGDGCPGGGAWGPRDTCSPGITPLMSLSGLMRFFCVKYRISFFADSNWCVAMSQRRDSGKILQRQRVGEGLPVHWVGIRTGLGGWGLAGGRTGVPQVLRDRLGEDHPGEFLLFLQEG